MNERIGFMQGRLSPLVDGKIQAFPWEHWRQEFPISKSLDIHLMEWTLDQDHLYKNPLMTEVGRSEIRVLCSNNKVRIPSLTGDCFMQDPFWKATGLARSDLE
jgi:hexulose-6-phosphate isomerase